MLYSGFSASSCQVRFETITVNKILFSVSTLSSKGKAIIKEARNFYRNILIQTITHKFPDWTHEQICTRLSQLLCFLPVMETAGRIEDDNLSVMTLFNVADMQGELTYEIHVRKAH